MASREKGDESPRDTNDSPQEQQQRNERADNPPMEGCSPTHNIPAAENISLPHLETLNLFCPLEPNPIRRAGLVSPGPPRMNPYASERVQSWLQNVRHTSSSGAPENSPATAMSDFAQRLSSDSLNDQRFTPLNLPFATRQLSEGLLSHFLIPDVPNFSPLIMTRSTNSTPSGSLFRPRLPSTPETTGRTAQDELLLRPSPRTSPPSRPEHTTNTYSGLFPCLSRITTPHQTTGPRTTNTCTSKSLTPGRLMSSIGLRGSNLPTSRITPTTPLQPRIFSFMMASNEKPRMSSSIVDPILRPNESSPLRVVLRPQRRVSLSALDEIIGSPAAPLANSTPEPITDIAPSSNGSSRPDIVPTRLESTRMQTIDSNPLYPITQVPILEQQGDSPTKTIIPNRSFPTEVPTLSHEYGSTRNAPTSIHEHGEILDTSTILHQREPISEMSVHLTPPFSTVTPNARPVTHVLIEPNPNHPVREAALIRETKTMVKEINRIISIRNPKTNEVKEYWVRQNAEMLSEVAGFVNDAAASALTKKRDDEKSIKKKSFKKKNLKGIQRKRANSVPSQSSSSGESPRQSAKSMSPQQRDAPPAFDPTKYIPPRGPRYQQIQAYINRRPKRPKKSSKSNSSGYPIWRDEIASSSSNSECERFVSDTSENQSTDHEFPELSLREKVETYLAHLRRRHMRDNEESE